MAEANNDVNNSNIVEVDDSSFQPQPIKYVSAFSSDNELEQEPKVPEATEPKAEEPKVPEAMEPKAEEPKVPEATEPKVPIIKDRFSLLSKRERELQKQAEEIKAVKSSEDWQQFNEFKKAKVNNDVAKKVETLGLSIEDVTNYHLNRKPENPEIDTLTRKVDKLEGDLTRKEKENQQQLIANEITKFSNSMQELIESDDNFELLRERSDIGMLLDAAELIYQETGKIPTAKDVCEVVEGILYEEEEAKLQSLLKTKKFASKFNSNSDVPAVEQPQASIQKEVKNTASSRTTLGNNSVNKGSVVNEVQILSDEERMAEAIKRLSFK